MKTKVIKIGNSQGVIIPKNIIKKLKISDNIEMYIVDNTLVLESMKNPRAGWGDKIKEAQKYDTQEKLLLDSLEDENLDFWIWE